MSRPPLKVDGELAAKLRRIDNALEQSRITYAAMVGQVLPDVSEVIAARISEKAAKIAEKTASKHLRRIERHRQREARRREHRAHEAATALPRGIVFAIVAAFCASTGYRHPEMFWMVFVALGFAMASVSALAHAKRRPVEEREDEPEWESEGIAEAEPVPGQVESRPVEVPVAAPQPPPAPPDPKVQRIQALCDKILAEIESGPPIVREVVAEPGPTIGGLRQACLETARRERELREVLTAQDEPALAAEREVLVVRVASEKDDIVRERFGQALKALDQRLANRADLSTAAARLEAENTRILYTLENLHMQLLRARSTDIGAPELGGKLRDSLRELGTQIDAVAEALEWASAPPTSGSAGTDAAAATSAAASSAVASADGSDAERAERADAARRAAAASAASHR